MHRVVIRWTTALAFVGAVAAPTVFAVEEAQKALPTLLIKGEVVSLDTSDQAASLLKVKDRYGFETPIYVTKDAKVTQGDKTLAVADLKQGQAVEVEYNFDINTAKRHAVKVTVSVPAASAAAATPAAAAPSSAAQPAAPSATAQQPAAQQQPAAATAATPAAAAPAASSAASAATPAATPTAAAAPSATPAQASTPTKSAASSAPAVKEHAGKEHGGEAVH